MSEVQSHLLKEQARSCYRGYIADYILNQRRNNRLAWRAEEKLVQSVIQSSGRAATTRSDLLVAFKLLIEEVEAEWAADTAFPPRPHGL